MLIQKRREQMKEFEKQERKIKELKASGASLKKAVSLILFHLDLFQYEYFLFK